MNKLFYKIKPIYTIAILFILLVISLFGYYFYQMNYRHDKIQVTISLVPQDSKITLNNKPYSNGVNYILPGEYNAIISKDGFGTIKTSYNLTDANESIIIGLVAESDEAKQWAVKNYKLYNDLENKMDDKLKVDGEQFMADHPITSSLPIKNYLYSIGYMIDSNDSTGKSIIITVDSSQQYRQSAILQIKNLGYNLADYNYNFANFNNPFKL